MGNPQDTRGLSILTGMLDLDDLGVPTHFRTTSNMGVSENGQTMRIHSVFGSTVPYFQSNHDQHIGGFILVLPSFE